MAVTDFLQKGIKNIMKCFDKRCKEHPCFALRPSGNCEALSDTAFGAKLCPFYQTKEERK